MYCNCIQDLSYSIKVNRFELVAQLKEWTLAQNLPLEGEKMNKIRLKKI